MDEAKMTATSRYEAGANEQLAMPPQPLYGPGAERHPLRHADCAAPTATLAARAFIIGMTLALTVAFAWALSLALALRGDNGTIVHYAFLTVSTLGFCWMAFGAANAMVGAYIVMSGRRGDTVELAPPSTGLYERTALLFPIYHEDPNAVAATIRELADDLEQQDVLTNFAVFVLSDSQDNEYRVNEARQFGDLAAALQHRVTLIYRNRERNVGKKAGNVAEWVTRWGHDFAHFVVFDADSRMSATTLSRLVSTMQQCSDTALIQTVPALQGSQTIFGRLQEFASGLSGRLAASGFAAWQGASGNYWGHNAIIRTRAFAACAGLPILPGKAPFGGHIQSHDFVEAALLRRAGWRVALVTSLDGSYEGAPQSLVDLAVRDRRWMQGNLQHGAVLQADGLHPVSRLHLAMGIVSYLSSVLWATMITLGLLLIWQEQERTLTYFANQKTLFPVWPTFDPQAGLRLLAATLLVVFLPKLIGLAVAAATMLRRGLGVWHLRNLLAIWSIELIFSALLAPVFMVVHMKSLVEILIGRDSGWSSQNRETSRLDWKTALRFHRLHVVVGLILVACAASLSWHALLWLSPVAIGLVGSPIVSVVTSMPARSDSPLMLAPIRVMPSSG
jgi:membrane glycosyltransferase